MNFTRGGQPRMPIWASGDKIRKQWLYSLVAFDVSYGLATTFFWSDGAPQVLMRSILPGFTTVWGVLIVVSGGLILFGWSVTGGILGTVTWGVLALASVMTVIIGTALSFSAPILLALPACVHGLISYEVSSGLDDDRERRQRGG